MLCKLWTKTVCPQFVHANEDKLWTNMISVWTNCGQNNRLLALCKGFVHNLVTNHFLSTICPWFVFVHYLSTLELWICPSFVHAYVHILSTLVCPQFAHKPLFVHHLFVDKSFIHNLSTNHRLSTICPRKSLQFVHNLSTQITTICPQFVHANHYNLSTICPRKRFIYNFLFLTPTVFFPDQNLQWINVTIITNKN